MWIAALEQLLFPTLLLFLLVGALGSLVLGATLALSPPPAIAFMHRMNRWVSTRRSLKPLEIPREAGQLSPRAKLALGAFLVLGAGFSLYFLVDSRLGLGRSASLAALAVETMRWVLVAGCALSFVLGLMLLFLPRPLAAVEATMNRWVSTRQIIPPASEDVRMPLDILVETHPKAAGVLIAAASLVVVAGLWVLLSSRLLR
jgi:hypothetical protein